MSYSALLIVLLLVLPAVGQWTYKGSFDVNNDVKEVSFSPDGSRILVVCNGGSVCLYDSTPTSFPIISGSCFNGGTTLTGKYSPNGNYIAVGSDGDVKIRNADNSPNRNFSCGLTRVDEVHFNKESSKLLVCGDGGFEIWDTSNWNRTKSDSSFSDPVISCRFADDGHFATGTSNANIRIYNSTADFQWSYTYGGGSPYISGVDFSPDSNYLLTGWSSTAYRMAIFSVGSNDPI